MKNRPWRTSRVRFREEVEGADALCSDSAGWKGGSMIGLSRICVLVLGISISFATAAMAGERNVLKALKETKGGVEAGVNYERYNELLAGAKVQIDAYKKGKTINKRFLENATACFSSYENAAVVWKQKMEFRVKGASKIVKEMVKEGKGRPDEIISVLSTKHQEYDNKMKTYWDAAAKELDKALESLK